MSKPQAWRDQTLDELLRAPRPATSPWSDRSRPTDGPAPRSPGSTDPNGRRFVLKRTSLAVDWIARATDDDRAARGLARDAGQPVAHLAARPRRSPYLGAAADGDGVAILMPTSRPSSSPGSGRTTTPTSTPRPSTASIRGDRPAARAAVERVADRVARPRGGTGAAVVSARRAAAAPLAAVRRRLRGRRATRSASGSSRAGPRSDGWRRPPRCDAHRAARCRPGPARCTALGDPARPRAPRRPEAGQRRPPRRRPHRVHRLADDAASPGRGRAGLVPRVEQRLAARRADRGAGGVRRGAALGRRPLGVRRRAPRLRGAGRGLGGAGRPDLDRRAAAARLAQGPRRRSRRDPGLGRLRAATTSPGGVAPRSTRRSVASRRRRGASPALRSARRGPGAGTRRGHRRRRRR